MFAIYNNGSVGFRSTADNLYNIKNTEAPLAVDLKPNDDTMFEQLVTSKKEEKNKQNTPNKEALSTYKKMANINTSEIIYHVQDIMNTQCINIFKNQTVKNAYDALKEYKVSQIPIISDEKKIIGLINKKIILNLLIEDLENVNEILNRKLDDLYLPQVITTDPITDIRRVAKVMLDFKLDAIPVVNEDDIIVGIVSKSDIIRAVSHIPKLQLWS